MFLGIFWHIETYLDTCSTEQTGAGPKHKSESFSKIDTVIQEEKGITQQQDVQHLLNSAKCCFIVCFATLLSRKIQIKRNEDLNMVSLSLKRLDQQLSRNLYRKRNLFFNILQLVGTYSETYITA